MFRTLLQSCGYELVTPVIDAKGGGNLLPQNIDAFLARLDTAGVERICISPTGMDSSGDDRAGSRRA